MAQVRALRVSLDVVVVVLGDAVEEGRVHRLAPRAARLGGGNGGGGGGFGHAVRAVRSRVLFLEDLVQAARLAEERVRLRDLGLLVCFAVHLQRRLRHGGENARGSASARGPHATCNAGNSAYLAELVGLADAEHRLLGRLVVVVPAADGGDHRADPLAELDGHRRVLPVPDLGTRRRGSQEGCSREKRRRGETRTGWCWKPNLYPWAQAHETWNSCGHSLHRITAPPG